MATQDVFGQLIGFLCLGLFVVIFLGAGVYLILRSRKDKLKVQQAMNWPSVTGKVLESRLIESTSTDSDGDSSTTYRPYIRYEYEMGGITYTNDKVDVGMVISTSGTKKANELLSRFSKGSAVLVYVNPDNPADSILEQKASTTATLVIGIALLITGLCIVLPIGLVLLLSIVPGN
ncbi:MAG: DUF3592 domain-containing protein [Bellilinea sp.]